jgi:hypothetical protein
MEGLTMPIAGRKESTPSIVVIDMLIITEE